MWGEREGGEVTDDNLKGAMGHRSEKGEWKKNV